MFIITTTSQSTTSSPLRRLLVRHPVVAFFVFTFAGAWLVWLPLILSQNSLGLLPFTIPESLFQLVFVLGVIAGPTLSAFLMTAITSGKTGVWQFLRRYVQWRVGLRWYLLSLFGFISVYLLVTSPFLGTTLLQALVGQWTMIFSVFLPAVLTVLLLGQLWEEPGWRGFALPRLQPRVGAAGASLIIGTLQALWHVPVLFMPGMIVPGKFVFTIPSFVGEVLGLVLVGMAIGVIVTWVSNNTQGSLLIVILFHTGWDATNHLVQHLIPAFFAQATLLTIVAYIACALLLIIFTKSRLSYKPDHAVQSADAARTAAGATS